VAVALSFAVVVAAESTVVLEAAALEAALVAALAAAEVVATVTTMEAIGPMVGSLDCGSPEPCSQYMAPEL
jgi:hypothetical protein